MDPNDPGLWDYFLMFVIVFIIVFGVISYLGPIIGNSFWAIWP